MNKKIIIISISILLLFLIIIGLIWIKNVEDKKTKTKEEITNLTENVKLTNYKIEQVHITSEEEKFKITFNITNTSKEAQNNDKIYIELLDSNEKSLETLQATLVSPMQPNQTISIEARGTIPKDKVKHIKYTTKKDVNQP